MIRRLTLAAALAALVCAVSAAPAAGSAIYNQSDQTSSPLEITVYFSCGTFCSNSWVIAPGDWKARAGKGGSFQIMGWPPPPPLPQCENDEHPNLQSHGWAQFTYDPNAQPPPGVANPTKYIWEIFDNNSNKVGNYTVTTDKDSCY